MRFVEWLFVAVGVVGGALFFVNGGEIATPYYVLYFLSVVIGLLGACMRFWRLDERAAMFWLFVIGLIPFVVGVIAAYNGVPRGAILILASMAIFLIAGEAGAWYHRNQITQQGQRG